MRSKAPSRERSLHVVRAMAIAALCSAARAQSNLPVPKYEESASVEAEVPLPPYPEAGDLVRFPTSWTTHEIAVDARSLVAQPDGPVRYTLVVRSSSGAENVSHEGLRCDSGERRVYAWGRRGEQGGTWTVARNTRWTPIGDRGINRYYFEFWRDVFCDGKVMEPRNVILDNLRRGGRVRAQSTPSD